MGYELLGEMRAVVRGRQIPLGPRQQRLLLACLLVDAGRVVPVETLIGRIWGECPPHRTREGLHVHLARLRTSLRTMSEATGEEIRLERLVGGYRLVIDPALVDLHQFESVVETAEGVVGGAVEDLGRALDLWRGTPLDGLPGVWARDVRGTVTTRLLHVLGRWGRACLQRGEPGAVAARLGRHLDHLFADDPTLRARTGSLLAAGRVTEALDLVVGSDRDSGPDLPTPAQLPLAVQLFTGRTAELGVLDDLLLRHRDSLAVTAVVVTGTAGVGKTALAVQWAHRVAEQFPDGTIYVDLRGYDPEHPLTPAEALAGFLGAFGIAGPKVPFDLTERAAAYRSVLAGRRVLVILDNAGSVDQVRPLLPGTSSCLVVVTSRDSLAELVTREGAHRIPLDLLPDAAATELMVSLVGARALTEPEALSRLVAPCAGLPLALRIAAELAAGRSTTALADLVAELADEEQRLSLMAVDGDLRSHVQVVFSWSYRNLAAGTARLFRVLGLHPGPDWNAAATAALAGCDLDTARHGLAALAGAHLVQRRGWRRYGMHELLHAYARRLSGDLDTEQDQREALTRLLDHAAASAASVLDPSSERRRPSRPVPRFRAPLPGVTDPAGARDWFDVERSSLVRLVAHATDTGHPEHTVLLAEILAGHLECGGHLADALTVHDLALGAARATGDLLGQAHALVGGGAVLCRWGRIADGACRLTEAAALAGSCGAVHIEARALHNLGFVEYTAGRRDESLDLLSRALPLWRLTDDRLAEARTLYAIATLEAGRGEYRQAFGHLESVLQEAVGRGDRRVEAEVRDGLGTVLSALDRHEEAARHFETALRIWREHAAPEAEFMVAAKLGTAFTRLGRVEEGLDLLHRSLDFHRRSGIETSLAVILNSIGRGHSDTGSPDEALARHREALLISERLGDRMGQAKAHDGLGTALTALGRTDEAGEHWAQALTLYREVGDVRAGTVEALLSTPPR